MSVCLLTWIGHHNEDAVRTVFDNLRDDVFENVDVSLHQVQSALTLLLTHSGRHHNDTRVSGHRVVYQKKKTNKLKTSDTTNEKKLRFSA